MVVFWLIVATAMPGISYVLFEAIGAWPLLVATIPSQRGKYCEQPTTDKYLFYECVLLPHNQRSLISSFIFCVTVIKLWSFEDILFFLVIYKQINKTKIFASCCKDDCILYVSRTLFTVIRKYRSILLKRQYGSSPSKIWRMTQHWWIVQSDPFSMLRVFPGN